MSKTILITGATDGIGSATAALLAQDKHRLIIHGRNAEKIQQCVERLRTINPSVEIDTFLADLSALRSLDTLHRDLSAKHKQIDVIINNAGVLKSNTPITSSGLDIRFVVNTIAAYFLTQTLLPLMPTDGRVVNIASQAQASVDLDALRGQSTALEHYDAYAQSKLALIMWTNALASARKPGTPLLVSVNPGSLLASKMVKQGFGIEGKDLAIGADILYRAALSAEFENANGRYYDNDAKCFADPHVDALSAAKCAQVVACIESLR